MVRRYISVVSIRSLTGLRPRGPRRALFRASATHCRSPRARRCRPLRSRSVPTVSVPTVLWFRRDLRLADHPALLAAAQEPGSSGLVPLFVFDPALWEPAGPPRRAWLLRSLRSLDERLGGRLVVRHGDPVTAVPAIATEVGAGQVHVTADAGVYGRRRDTAVARALAGTGGRLVATGTPYAVGPGTLLSGAGTPFKVFSAFERAWVAHGYAQPARSAAAVEAGTWAGGV